MTDRQTDPTNPASTPTSAQLPATPASCHRIADAAQDAGYRASTEYPAHVRLVALNGRVAHVGTANGPWQLDVYRSAATEALGQVEATRIVPPSHRTTAEGIARFAIGTITGIRAYMAYASAREQQAADRAERKARNGRR